MEKRTPLIAGNWKMHKTCAEAVDAAKTLVHLVSAVTERDIMIAPVFTALYPVSAILDGTQIHLGAQNIHWEDEGAFTGEVSGKMLISAGCRYVIIGHSERRQFFHESDQWVNLKIRAAVKSNLIPVMCIGETETEYEQKNTLSVLDKQIKKGLEGSFSDSLANLVIAYEPVWAIGTGKTAKSAQAQEVHHYIRSLIEKLFGNVLAKSIRIIYGGSVKPENISELMNQPDIDGVLVGGASLIPETFSRIVLYQ
ncbi:MAG: triose-phosphate isomerase [Proteobacteria bacterium]|nr:triose-phosphate isomerase [Pseudomonadota bacterium]